MPNSPLNSAGPHPSHTHGHTHTHIPHTCTHTVTTEYTFVTILHTQVRRFPYEKYPPHVHDVRNYAFKALVLAEALVSNAVVLWIDSGLELRAPMDT